MLPGGSCEPPHENRYGERQLCRQRACLAAKLQTIPSLPLQEILPSERVVDKEARRTAHAEKLSNEHGVLNLSEGLHARRTSTQIQLGEKRTPPASKTKKVNSTQNVECPYHADQETAERNTRPQLEKNKQ